MVILTKEQRKALFQLYRRDWPSLETPFKNEYGRVSSIPYRMFRKGVHSYMDKSGCVILPWKGMWIGIETDGYVHS
jgi:hypothetical protein